MPVTAPAIALGHLRRIVEQKQRLEREYVDAMLDARVAGCTFAQIGRAAGIKRASAFQLIKRHTP